MMMMTLWIFLFLQRLVGDKSWAKAIFCFSILFSTLVSSLHIHELLLLWLVYVIGLLLVSGFIFSILFFFRLMDELWDKRAACLMIRYLLGSFSAPAMMDNDGFDTLWFSVLNLLCLLNLLSHLMTSWFLLCLFGFHDHCTTLFGVKITRFDQDYDWTNEIRQIPHNAHHE